jgi:hypothetical protein
MVAAGRTDHFRNPAARDPGRGYAAHAAVSNSADAGDPALALVPGGRAGACRQKNITVHSLDLLIATTAIHHGAEVVTFDAEFQKIASVSKLLLKTLKRPTA